MSAAEKPPPPPELPPNDADACLAVLDMIARHPVMLYVDSRRSEVIAPEFVKKAHGPVLPILIGRSHMLTKPLMGLEIDLQGIRASISFNGKDHWCDFPWSAIWKAHCPYKTVLWGHRAPGELVTQGVVIKDDNKTQRSRVAPGQVNPSLKLVEPEIECEPTPPITGHLSLVPPISPTDN